MDNHSKHVCLIGVLHFLFYLVFSVDPLMRSYRYSFSYYDSNLAFGGYFILMAILSALMIRGAKQKDHKLVAPFLVLSSTYLLYELGRFATEFISEFGVPFYFYEDNCYRIGITTISLYPIYTLHSKLRSQYLKEKSLNNLSKEEKKKTTNALKQQLVV